MNLEHLASLLPASIRPSPRFLGFLLVGGVNTAFGYGMFVVCLWLGMHYAVAAAVATLLGVLFNFFSTGGLVFKNRDRRRLPSSGLHPRLQLCDRHGGWWARRLARSGADLAGVRPLPVCTRNDRRPVDHRRRG